MAQGLQHIPLRVPAEWDPKWFTDFCRDVLALADVRNAIGEGLDISGQSAEVATLAVSADIQALLEQPFVLAQPSGFLENERTLAGEADVIQILDGGPDANITVALIDGGLPLGKLKELTDYGVLGNPVDGGGAVQNIIPSGDKAVLHVAGTAIEFDLIDSTYISDFEEAVQDVMGSTLTDSTGVDWVYDDLTGTILANLNFANPTASIGLTAVNGTAATPMRSDAAPALDQGIAPTWTNNHRWTDNDQVQLGTGGDLVLYHDGTDSYINNATGELRIGAFAYFNGPAGTTREFGFESSGSQRWLFRCTSTAESGGNAGSNFQWISRTDAGATLMVVLSILRASGNFLFENDNQEIRLGASQDLRLYHDGANSIVRTDTGGLRLQFGTNNRLEVNTTGVGFNGATPIARPDYTVTNPTTNRSIDVSTITHANLAQVVGTMIQDLINYGLYQ